MKTRTHSSVYDLQYEDIAALAGDRVAATVFRHLYRERRRHSPEIERVLAAAGITAVAPLSRRGVDQGAMTTKHLFGLPDAGAIEAVRIRRRTGVTACVSSQVGCAFGCQFCASGKLGLQRQLRSGEIVQQVLELGAHVNRVVYMGIGEPLHNYTEVLRSIRTLRDRRGLGLPTSGITISTIGLPHRLARLREEHLKINLTVSLHATTDEVRHRLIPGARGFRIADVVHTSQRWAERHNRVVTYVYLLLPGVNDTPDDLQRLGDLMAGRRARVNLMRWNPVLGGDQFRRVDDRGLSRFKRELVRRQVPTVVRDTQGRDIDAACGQLWLRDVAGR